MRIHVSETTKHLLDKVGGFRCDYRGIFDLEVLNSDYIIRAYKIFIKINRLRFNRYIT